MHPSFWSYSGFIPNFHVSSAPSLYKCYHWSHTNLAPIQYVDAHTYRVSAARSTSTLSRLYAQQVSLSLSTSLHTEFRLFCAWLRRLCRKPLHQAFSIMCTNPLCDWSSWMFYTIWSQTKPLLLQSQSLLSCLMVSLEGNLAPHNLHLILQRQAYRSWLKLWVQTIFSPLLPFSHSSHFL